MSRQMVGLVAGLLVVAGVFSTGCAPTKRADVVASFYPLQFVAQRVVGSHLSVVNLAAPGQEPHDLELTARQRETLSHAKVVLYEKGLQPSIDEAVADSDPDHSIDAAQVVGLRRSGERGDQTDPHFWLDPVLLIKVVRAVSTAVGAVDPQHRSDYRANADKLIAELTTLDEDYRAGLARCATRTLVVSHDAFEYLGARYHLKVVPIAGVTPDAEPSAKRLGQLRKLIEAEGVSTIFSETLASPKLARALADDTGVRTEVLDPLEGLTKHSAGADYLSVMRSNLERIRQANSCS